MPQPGDRVQRIEDRADTGATVLAIGDGEVLLIGYDEGGEGWWPLQCLRPDQGEA